MSLISSINFIINHPLNKDNKVKAVSRFIKWQLNNIINPYPIIYPFTDKSKLIIKKGMKGATGNLYCGLHEYQDMFFLLHFLKESDMFVDIGANIGSYTVLAAGHINAKTISIEPVPSTYSNLINNISINNIQNIVEALNIALGSEKGNISFTKTQDTSNHVATQFDKEVINVNVNTLDKILFDKKVPALIKIDVEGFETEVLNGAAQTLIHDDLKAIIIELNGLGARYNYDETLIHKKLIDLGFKPHIYNPINRTLTEVKTFGSHNTIYIRDIDSVTERLKTSAKVKILEKTI